LTPLQLRGTLGTPRVHVPRYKYIEKIYI